MRVENVKVKGLLNQVVIISHVPIAVALCSLIRCLGQHSDASTKYLYPSQASFFSWWLPPFIANLFEPDIIHL